MYMGLLYNVGGNSSTRYHMLLNKIPASVIDQHFKRCYLLNTVDSQTLQALAIPLSYHPECNGKILFPETSPT